MPLFSGFYDNETLVRIMYEDFIKGKYSTKHFIYVYCVIVLLLNCDHVLL